MRNKEVHHPISMRQREMDQECNSALKKFTKLFLSFFMALWKLIYLLFILGWHFLK